MLVKQKENTNITTNTYQKSRSLLIRLEIKPIKKKEKLALIRQKENTNTITNT